MRLSRFVICCSSVLLVFVSVHSHFFFFLFFETLQTDLRLGAVICLKRTVLAHWRPRKAGVYVVSDEEKLALKSFLLSHSEEPIRKLSVQLSVVIGDIARRDWPDAWVELFNSLLNTITTVNTDVRLMCFIYKLTCFVRVPT